MFKLKEQIPTSFTIKKLRDFFEQFGTVVYVSLPRHREKIKEYAFIEFQSKKSVRKAIDAYTKYDSVISDDSDPLILMSTKSYMDHQHDFNYQDHDQMHQMPSHQMKRGMNLMAPPQRDYNEMPSTSNSNKRFKINDQHIMMPPQHTDWRNDPRNPDYYTYPRAIIAFYEMQQQREQQREHEQLQHQLKQQHSHHSSHAYQHSQQIAPRHLQHPSNLIQQPPLFYTDYTMMGESSNNLYDQLKPPAKVTVAQTNDYFENEYHKFDTETIDECIDPQHESSDDDSNSSSDRNLVNSTSDKKPDEENYTAVKVPKRIRKRRNAVDCKEPNPLHNLKIMKK